MSNQQSNLGACSQWELHVQNQRVVVQKASDWLHTEELALNTNNIEWNLKNLTKDSWFPINSWWFTDSVIIALSRSSNAHLQPQSRPTRVKQPDELPKIGIGYCKWAKNREPKIGYCNCKLFKKCSMKKN